MNIIKNAILNGLENASSDRMQAFNWRQFHRECVNKRVFIFGGTKACDYFLRKYKNKYKPECILDNSREKQGHFYREFSENRLTGQQKMLKVEGIDALRRYPPEQTVVLIASTRYYGQIADQLAQIGYNNYFVLCIMEAKKWKYRIFKFYIEKKKKLVEAVCRETGWSLKNFNYILRFYREWRQPIQENKIVFYTFGGYMDHGKYIAEELMKRGSRWDIVWLVTDRDLRVPSKIRKVDVSDINAYIHELATAAIWVNDVMYPYYVRKRKKQFYIQTKHWGSVTLKKFYFDAASLYTFPAEIRNWKRNSKMMDCMITGSDFDTQSCRSGFRFKGEIWKTGSPRSDILFIKGAGMPVYHYFEIKEGSRILLYAPTYRFVPDDPMNRPKAGDFGINYFRIREALRERFGGEWVILLRLHPSVARQSAQMRFPDFVKNASYYPDSQELIAASSVMISDYSSIIFEPCYVKKPVFLYTADLEKYVQKEYELLISMEELPFSHAKDEEELLYNILSFDEKKYDKTLDDFLEKFGVNEDGHASGRAAERIGNLIKRNERNGRL